MKTDCERTTATARFDIQRPTAPAAQAEVDLRLTAAADLNIKFDIDAYVFSTRTSFLKIFDIAKGQFGVVAQIPVRFYGVIGNRCSDADNDGVNELVRTDRCRRHQLRDLRVRER